MVPCPGPAGHCSQHSCSDPQAPWVTRSWTDCLVAGLCVAVAWMSRQGRGQKPQTSWGPAVVLHLLL